MGINDLWVVNPPPGDFIRRYMHASVVIGDWVYVDGGYVIREHDTWQNEYDANTTLAIPLDGLAQPATIMSNQHVLENYPPPEIYLAQFVHVPGRDYAIKIGGQFTTDSPHYIWRFTPDGRGGGDWVEGPYPPNQPKNSPVSSFMTSSNSMSYIYGGADNFGGSFLHTVSAWDWQDESWGLIPSPLDSDFGVTGGTAEWSESFGSSGLGFFFGGWQSHREASNQDGSFAPMDNITIFDPSTKSWSWQMTNGTAPSGRAHFCTVSATDAKGSQEFFFYGGQDSETYGGQYSVKHVTVFKDVYVLTVPGFQWFKASTSDGNMRRTYHSCHAVGNRQMMVIGGVEEWNYGYSTLTGTTHTPDPLPLGFGFYDMTELKWKDGYEKDSPAYESPLMVGDWYADKSFDDVAWSSDRVKGYFNKFQRASSTLFGQDHKNHGHHVFSGPREGSTLTNSQNPSNIPSNAVPAPTKTVVSDNSSDTVAAAVGSVIGIVICITFVAFGFWFFFRRRRRRLAAESAGKTENGEAGTPDQHSSSLDSSVEAAGDAGRFEIANGGMVNEIENSGVVNEAMGGAVSEMPGRHTTLHAELDPEAAAGPWPLGSTKDGVRPRVELDGMIKPPVSVKEESLDRKADWSETVNPETSFQDLVRKTGKGG